MKLLDKIVNTINDRLFDSVLDEHAFQNSSVNGLSYLTTPKDQSPQRPYTFDDDNIIDISLDDTYDFSIYHRCTDINYKDAPASAWGDGDGMIMASFSMVAIVFGDRMRLGYTPEDLILKLTSGMNVTFTKTELDSAGLSKVRVMVSKVNNNSRNVFLGEYGMEANCPLQMTSIYFGIQYTIEITANSKCLDCQDC
jgi:hypothetical protein